MSSINSRVIPEFIGVLYCFICCKVSSPTSLNCYSFDKQLSGSLQFPEGNTDSPLNCFDFRKSLGLRMGLQPGAPFPILPFLQAPFNLISCSKVVPRNGSLVQSLKENFFFPLLHLGGILRIRNLKIQNIGALMKFGDYLLKWFTSCCSAHGHWWLSSMLWAPQKEWLQRRVPHGWRQAGGQLTHSQGLSQWVQLFLLLRCQVFMLASVRLPRGRTLIPGPNRWVQPEELPFNLIYFGRVPLWNRCGKLPIYSTTPLLISEKKKNKN